MSRSGSAESLAAEVRRHLSEAQRCANKAASEIGDPETAYRFAAAGKAIADFMQIDPAMVGLPDQVSGNGDASGV